MSYCFAGGSGNIYCAGVPAGSVGDKSYLAQLLAGCIAADLDPNGKSPYDLACQLNAANSVGGMDLSSFGIAGGNNAINISSQNLAVNTPQQGRDGGIRIG